MTAHRHGALATLALAGLLGYGDRSFGATIVEYFNGYGANNNLTGLGAAGDGWQGAWTGTVPADPPNTFAPLYEAGASLSFDSPNYNNSGNGTGGDDGLATRGPGATAAHYAGRAFSTGLTGTIWISALAHYTSSTADALLILDTTTGPGSNFVAIRNTDAVMRSKDGSASVVTDDNEFGVGADNVYAANSTYLFLVRIQMNAVDTSDQVDFWIFDADENTTTIPDLPSTEAGLPAIPSFSKLGNFYGDTFDAIGIAFEDSGSRIDAIRISNDANGFAQVTSVPEPATLGAAAMGLCLLQRRSRRR